MNLPIPKGIKPKRNKPKRLKAPKHLEYVSTLACCCCGKMPVEVHHLIGRYGVKTPARGWGLRAGDNFVIPLCPECHRQGVHGIMGEVNFLKNFKVDGIVLANKLWEKTNGNKD